MKRKRSQFLPDDDTCGGDKLFDTDGTDELLDRETQRFRAADEINVMYEQETGEKLP